MPLHLYNTLSGKVEEFQPLTDNTVRMYNCGPTVYDFAHIGNFRTFIAIDILRRWLRVSGYGLKHVMNITDVDDRIIANSAKLGIAVRQYTEKFEKLFLEDSAILSIERPEASPAPPSISPKWSTSSTTAQTRMSHIAPKTAPITSASPSSPNTASSRRKTSHIEDGARVDSDRFDKEEARDFALWKAPKPGEALWDTDRPRTPRLAHRVLAMAMKYLGETLRHSCRRRGPHLPAS